MNVSADFKPVLTRAALALQKSKGSCDFTALVFQEPQAAAAAAATGKRQAKPTADGAEADADAAGAQRKPGKDAATDNEFDIKKARHEVINFATANQRTLKNKRKMEILQLVKLGAKPPKKEYRNYKDLKAERQRLKDNREERRKFHQLGKTQTGAASVRCNNRAQKKQQSQKKRAPVANIGQHYGKAQPKFKKRN
ncbi:hypothetical protein KR222_009860 [Zaprionus bogoriensis]|nr:hypothetical protein KR222_009860 [Zaprionus bogoriensis]